MAHFSESLCEEVIKTEGKCSLTRNETVQMARFALRAIRNENPLLVDAVRYRFLRETPPWKSPVAVIDAGHVGDDIRMLTHDALDAVIDVAMQMGSVSGAASRNEQEKP